MMYIAVVVERELGIVVEYDPVRESTEELLSEIKRRGLNFDILYEGSILQKANQAVIGIDPIKQTMGRDRQLETMLTELFESKRK